MQIVFYRMWCFVPEVFNTLQTKAEDKPHTASKNSAEQA